MPIDASIYGLQKPIEMPSIADAQEKAARLSQYGMQQAQGMKKMERESKEEDIADHKRKFESISGVVESLAELPAAQRAEMWKPSIARLVQERAINPGDVPGEYDDGFFNQTFAQVRNTKGYLDKQGAKMDMQLKQSQIAKNYADAQKEKSAGSGKPMAAEQTDRMAGYDSSISMLSDLRDTLEAQKDNFGPISGRAASANPWNTSGQSVDAIFNKAAQTIGKALEGGKLTDADISRYRSMLPKQSDTPEVASEKIDQIERMIAERRNADIGTFAKAGLNVENFRPGAVPDIGVTKWQNKKPGAKIVPDAKAAQMPDFDKMSDAEIDKYLGGN